MAQEKDYFESNGLLYLWTRLKQIFYQKPQSGVPKSDLAEGVQTSLGKADTALQSFTETDPTVPAWAKQPNKPTYTASEVGAVTEQQMNAAIATAMKGGYQLVAELPTATADTQGKIYLVPNSGSGTNTKDEYITVLDGSTYRWEKIGTTDIDLSGYVQSSDLVPISNEEIDDILAS